VSNDLESEKTTDAKLDVSTCAQNRGSQGLSTKERSSVASAGAPLMLLLTIYIETKPSPGSVSLARLTDYAGSGYVRQICGFCWLIPWITGNFAGYPIVRHREIMKIICAIILFFGAVGCSKQGVNKPSPASNKLVKGQSGYYLCEQLGLFQSRRFFQMSSAKIPLWTSIDVRRTGLRRRVRRMFRAARVRQTSESPLS